MEKELTELEKQNIVVCAWRLDTRISAEKYIDALDKLILLTKKEVFDDVDQFVRKYDFWLTNSEVDIAYRELKQRHLSTLEKPKEHN